MKQVPTGTELARPFIPARDFALSKHFYETLGFEKLLDGDVAIFRAGSGGFILQPHYEKDWAENFMMQLMVDDLDAWWGHIDALDLPGKFKVPASARAGDAAMGPSDRLCCGSIWSALAHRRTTQGCSARLKHPSAEYLGLQFACIFQELTSVECEMAEGYLGTSKR